MDIAGIAFEGMRRAEAKLEGAARGIARPAPLAEPRAPADTVRLSEEIAALIEARNAFAANARVARTADQLRQHLLDLLG